MTPPGLDTIFLDISTFSQKYENVLFTIIHEIGHIFDFKGSGGDSSLYKSNSFIDQYAPGCYINYFGCVPNDPAKTNYPTILVQGNPGWNPTNPDDTTPYGLNASIDDFADSFAAYVMQAGGLELPWDVSAERKAIIALWVDLYK
jgi:hypothetical protein